MIRNERQYRVSASQRDKLENEIALVDASLAPDWVIEDTKAALESQISDINAEIAEYDSLQSQHVEFSVSDIASVPRELIRARIARHMSQRDLATALGIQEQQVQRYESTDYSGASVARLGEVMAALDVHLVGELSLQNHNDERATVRRALASTGLSSETIRNRFFVTGPANGGNWLSAASRAARVFDSSLENVLSGEVREVVSAGAFHAAVSASRERISGYAKYAEYLAQLAVNACRTEYRPLPSIEELRFTLGAELYTDPLRALLQTCWEHGVPVVPVTDSGAFYGACWFFGGRPAIVLKNQVRTPERWSSLLAHEMDHAAHPGEESVLELGLDVSDWQDQPVERRATDNANLLLLGDAAEAMAQVAVERAGHSTARLKRAVIDVAEAERVSVGLLADYVAHRVSSPGVNWWATANGLHSSNVDAWLVARSALFSNVNLNVLDALDRDILIDGMAP
jgi:transcriptional regulator with XRE-family HTH domain